MKKFYLKSILLLCTLVVGSGSVWADVSTLTPTSGKIAPTDDHFNVTYGGSGSSTTWGSNSCLRLYANNTITFASKNGEKITQITFTGTVNANNKGKYPTSMSANVGSITPSTISATGSTDFSWSYATGTTSVTITIGGTAGNIDLTGGSFVVTYTPSSTPSSNATFANKTPSVDWPTNTTFTQTATTASGYTEATGASVTYSIGATNTCGASINAETGEVTFTQGGSLIVIVTAAAATGFEESTDSYTLTVNDVRANADLAWSNSQVEIIKDATLYTLPTLTNPHSVTINNYTATGTAGLASVTSAGVVTVNTGTVGTATIKAIFGGNSEYKPQTVSYTINVVDPTVKGSKYNPYTVAEVIGQETATTFGDNIYVLGYIVGNYNATAPVVPATGDTNLALADASDENTGSNTIPVELPNNSIRTNWGPKSNDVIGYKVLLKGNAKEYFTTKGIKGTSEITEVIPLTPAKTYTTLTSAKNLNFTIVTGLKAYIATEIADSKVQMVQVNKVPANTGLVLKATTPGSAVNVPVFDGTSADDVSGNKMAGSATETTAIAANGGYILSDGKFQPALAGTLAAGKAYLNIAVSARSLELDFGDETTALTLVNSEKRTVNSEVYNLAGQRVAQPTKGLYIVNGRKVVVK